MSELRVLIVDDEPAIRGLLVEALEGHAVVTAPNGAVALSIVERERPDVIFLDRMMPVMDGLEFVQRYREIPGRHAPLIAMTASMNAQVWGAEIDAAGVLSKPFDLDDVDRLLLEVMAPRVAA